MTIKSTVQNGHAACFNKQTETLEPHCTKNTRYMRMLHRKILAKNREEKCCRPWSLGVLFASSKVDVQ